MSASAPTRSANASRPLIVLALVLVALGAWTFWPGTSHVPKLGLDLQGGTQVILQPRVEEGKTITADQLATTVSIIRQRVDSFGVAEAEVTTQGSGNDATIIVSIPGTTSQEVLDTIKTTAALDFRPVISADAGSPAPAPSVVPNPSGSAATTAPTTSASPVVPSVAASSTPSAATASATPNGAVLSKALAAAATSAPAVAGTPAPPIATPSATATNPVPTATPTAAPTSTGAVTPPAGALVPPVLGATQAEVEPKFAELNCGLPGVLSGGRLDDPTKWMATCSTDGLAKYLLSPAAVRGTQISDASATLGQGVAGWQVNLSFNASGATDFAKVTSELAGKQPPQNQFAIVLDGLVQSAPRVNEPITGGTAQITGNFTQEEAKNLANVLKFGALPITLDVQSVDSVSPTLGSDQLRAGILAGILGLLLVVIYLLVYYRALGVVAVLSLLVAAALTYFLFVVLGRTIGFTLSLAGVAGAIIAIGITADSFVVYFERIRDEIREGRTLRQACDAGWIRSRRTILAADFVSLLAAVVLYVVSVGNVRGFAFTLGLTTVIDVFVAFLFTRPLVSLLARNPWFSQGGPWTGLDPKRLGVTEIATGTRRKPTSGSARKSLAAAGATTATALAETDEAFDDLVDAAPTNPAGTPNPDGEV